MKEAQQETDTAKTTITIPDRYEAVHGIEGGMGLVVFCRDRQDDNNAVVLKCCKPVDVSRFKNRQQFLQEISNWISLGQHPNIVSVYRVEQAGSPPWPFLVLQQIGDDPNQGVSLAHHLHRRKNRPFSFRRALEITRDVCDGMIHAQSRIPGIVHRDLKPGNILMDDSGNARITDFGLARNWEKTNVESWRKATAHLLDSPDFKPAGTPAYNAPECWEPQNIPHTTTDIYAVGLILFELLTGTRAVATTKPEEYQEFHQNGQLPPLSDALPNCLISFIKKSTAIDPAHRQQSWQELQSDLVSAYAEICGHNDERETSVAAAPLLPEEEIKTSINIAESYSNLGYRSVAEHYLNAGLQKAVDNNHDDMRITLLVKLAILHESRGMRSSAIETLEQALALSPDKNRNQEQNKTRIDILSLLGNLYAQDGERTNSITMLEKSLTISRSIDDREGELTCLGNLANTYGELEDYDLALINYQKLLELLKQNEDPILKSRCLGNIGIAQLALGDLQSALENFKEALKETSDLADWFGQGQLLKRICETYLQLNDTEAASRYKEQFQELAGQTGKILDTRWIESTGL